MQHIINREKELKFLNELSREKKAQLVIIYGRRRIGKTFLTKHFLQDKNSVYYLCTRGNEKEQIRIFSEILAEKFGDAALKLNPFEDWHSLFVYLYEMCKKERIFLALDEFPYIIDSNRAFSSILQRYWDEYLSKTDVFLILSGSSVGMMEKETMEYRAPLYGRRTGQWRLGPLGLKDVVKFFPGGAGIEEIIEFHAVTGGIPFYLAELDLQKSLRENYLTRMARKGRIIYEEGGILLKEELPEPQTFFSIMEAISRGKRRQGEIANYIGMQGGFITRYLSKLLRLGFIKREVPVTEKRGTKRVLYGISDAFLDFWFKFIYPYSSYIESEEQERIGAVFDSAFNSYMGAAFEGIAVEFLISIRDALPFEFSKLGKWWYKDEEIDVVALNEGTKEIAFFECKWGNVGKRDAGRIISDLKRKATVVQWHNARRRERYGIVAKRLAGKDELRSAGYFAYDLDDLERQLR